jgi:uncharacterized protein (TIGR02145 family)
MKRGNLILSLFLLFVVLFISGCEPQFSERSCSIENCDYQACLEIQNVDIINNDFDVCIENSAGCWSCSNSDYSDQSTCENAEFCSNSDYPDQSTCENAGYCSDPDYTYVGACENFGGIYTFYDYTWSNEGNIWDFYKGISLSNCNGIWFDGNIGGFQFKLFGVEITGADGGIAGDLEYMISTTSSTVLGYSLTGAVIPNGTNEVLTAVSFSDFENSICFGEDTGSYGGTVLSDSAEGYVNANWGNCYCTIDGEIDLGCGCGEDAPDCAGLCGGNAVNTWCNDSCGITGPIDDCAGVCGGNAIVDDCGVCDGDNINENEFGQCDCSDQSVGDVWADCLGDCDGNSEEDCLGDCNGTEEEDSCGICEGPGEIYECGCNDILDGDCSCDNEVLDECGVCGGDSSSCVAGDLNGDGGINVLDVVALVELILGDGDYQAGADLNGDGGINLYDVIGLLQWVMTGSCPANFEDCFGVCGGYAVIDECGVCGGDGVIDDCGICSGGTTNHEANSDMDVCGVCNGDGKQHYCCDETGPKCSEANCYLHSNCAGVCGGDPEEVCTVTDIDSNTYQTVQIGYQVWLAENLRVTTLNNGEELRYLYDGSWGPSDDYDPYWCSYRSNVLDIDELQETYGNLYNWYAVSDERGLCPEGWHVPSDQEFIELEIYLGMADIDLYDYGDRGSSGEGGKLKSTGIAQDGSGLWIDPNEGATDEVGFTALPGGHRISGEYQISDAFHQLYQLGYFWSSTPYEDSEDYAVYRRLKYDRNDIYRSYNEMSDAFSVRCIKNFS